MLKLLRAAKANTGPQNLLLTVWTAKPRPLFGAMPENMRELPRKDLARAFTARANSIFQIPGPCCDYIRSGTASAKHLTGYRLIEPVSESHWLTPQEAFGVAEASGEGEAAGAVDFLWCL